MLAQKAVLALLGISAHVFAYWRMSCPSRLIDERADPIVAPSVISPHVHTIAGGNAFGMLLPYNQTQKSTCSSCQIKQDLSNYWTPQLYFAADNGTFIAVPHSGDQWGQLGGMTVYYEQRPGAGETLTAFPEGFRMIAGNPFKRNFTGDLAAQAVQFVCLDYTAGSSQSNDLPDKNCPDGLRPQVYFPSCWNGRDLDSPDHSSHVSYPNATTYDNGPCPSDFPVHFISIFFEVNYNTAVFEDLWTPGQGKQPFVFAMGDPTGYGFHGDFVNGWNVPALQEAVDTCNDPNGIVPNCPVFDLFTDEESLGCKTPSISGEVINGTSLTALPGCNPIQYGPGQATQATSCTSSATATLPALFNPTDYSAGNTASSEVSATDVPSPHPDSTTIALSRPSQSFSSSPGPSSRTATSPSSLGSSVTSTFNLRPSPSSESIPSSTATSSSSTTPNIEPSEIAGWSYAGCGKDNYYQRTFTGPSTNVKNMTIDSCIEFCRNGGYYYAGVEYSTECYCSFTAPSSDRTPSFNQRDPSVQCNMPCGGDATQMCGGWAAMNVYQCNSRSGAAMKLS